MSNAALWLGLGKYGTAAIETLVARRKQSRLAVVEEGSSVTVHWSALSPDGHADKGRPPDTLTRATSAALPAETRRGNFRQRCYLYVVAHAVDVAGWVELQDPAHWLWALPRTLNFNFGQIVLLVSLDGLRASARDDQMDIARAALGPVEAAMRQASIDADGFARVITVQATDPADRADIVPTSMGAIVLLAEMIENLEADPGTPALLDLLGQEAGDVPTRVAPEAFGSSEADDTMRAAGDAGRAFVEHPRTPAAVSARAFGIEALRYQRWEGVSHANDQLLQAIGLSAKTAPSEVVPDWRVDLSGIPKPDVPTDVTFLSWSKPVSFLTPFASALRTVNNEESRIETELPGGWRAQVGESRVDVSHTRRVAAQTLREAAADFENRVSELWGNMTSLAALDAFLAAATNQVARRTTSAAVQAVPPEQPSFTREVEGLRTAVAARPDAPMTLLLVLWSVLLGAVLTWFAIEASLDRVVPGLSSREGSLLALALSALGGLLVGSYALYAWVVRPWQKIRAAERRIDTQMVGAKRSIQDYREQLAEYVLDRVRAEVLALLGARVSRAADGLHQFQAGIDDLSSEGIGGAVEEPSRLLLETSLPIARREGLGRELEEQFRERHVPDGLLENGMRIPVVRRQLGPTLRELAADHVDGWVAQHPLGPSDMARESPHVLASITLLTQEELHVPRAAEAERNGDAGVYPDVRRPDRAYWLVVGTIPEAVPYVRAVE
jgi:hypothetical protein